MKILLIRRDNIGDLILTTPLIKTLAKHHQVDVLVNSYNQAVLDGNPDVHTIYLYTKLHHRKKGQSALSVLIQRLKTIIKIRKAHYDVAIVPCDHWNKRALKWAQLSGAKRIIAMGDDAPHSVTDKLPSFSQERLHIVEVLSKFTQPLGIFEEPGSVALYVSQEEIQKAAKIHKIDPSKLRNPHLPIYGLQISSRKIRQRWPTENFIQLAKRLDHAGPCQILLFWSPGDLHNKEHPGDDQKAQEIIQACQDLNISIKPIPTKNIRELMVAMSVCDQILTSDGGALHIAVGVKTPVVALFGSVDSYHWAPWNIPHRLIDGADQDVKNISVELAYEKFTELREEILELKKIIKK